MGFTELLIIMLLLALAGAADFKSICPSDVVVGQPAELTCEINGNVSNGVNWYRSGEGIIGCTISGLCLSFNHSLFSTTDMVNNVQKLTILSVSEDDLTRTWTCVDGAVSSTGSSGCKLAQKEPAETTTDTTAETTADCKGGNLNKGKPFNISCYIKGTVVKGINWFRDGKNIIVCQTKGECETNDPGSYKTENVSNNRHQFTILDVTEDDLRKTWTCVDDTETDNKTEGCSLIRLIEEAKEKSAVSSFTVAVVLVIVDVIIYFVFKDNLSKVKKVYIIYCVVDVLVVGIVCGVSIYYIYLRTSDIGIIAGTCIGFLVVSTVIKIIVLKTELFSKCS